MKIKLKIVMKKKNKFKGNDSIFAGESILFINFLQ